MQAEKNREYVGMDHARSGSEEFLRHPHQLSGVRPDERMVSAIDDDKPRTRNAVVKHLRVEDRHRIIVRASDDECRASDFSHAAPAVKRHRLLPRKHHQLLILARHNAGEPVGTFLAEMLRAKREDDKSLKTPSAANRYDSHTSV